jgi:hypothetical protein
LLSVSRFLERFAGGPLLLGPPAQLPLGEQGPAELEGHREALVVGQGLLNRRGRVVRVLLNGEQQSAGPGPLSFTTWRDATSGDAL